MMSQEIQEIYDTRRVPASLLPIGALPFQILPHSFTLSRNAYLHASMLVPGSHVKGRAMSHFVSVASSNDGVYLYVS